MRIYIFGSAGSGKTTVAKKISQKLNIPNFDLDEIFWNFEYGKKNETKRKEEVNRIISKKDWIIEGMYRDEWLKDILSSSDYIFILKPSKILLYWRIIKRTLLRIFQIEKYKRKSDINLLSNLLDTAKKFDKERLPEFLSQVNSLNKKTIFVENEQQILQNLKTK
ncbi:MAG: shikimate kinase [Patescibacteria group bacterium]|nr:shikimate kinase [Patescibacteria group bacterium]